MGIIDTSKINPTDVVVFAQWANGLNIIVANADEMIALFRQAADLIERHKDVFKGMQITMLPYQAVILQGVDESMIEFSSRTETKN